MSLTLNKVPLTFKMERLGRMESLTSKMYPSREEHFKPMKNPHKQRRSNRRGKILKEAV